MVIIGLLTGFIGPKYFAHIGKSEVKTTRAQLVSLEKSLDQYRLDTGHYPTIEQGLAALYTRPYVYKAPSGAAEAHGAAIFAAFRLLAGATMYGVSRPEFRRWLGRKIWQLPKIGEHWRARANMPHGFCFQAPGDTGRGSASTGRSRATGDALTSKDRE